MFYFVVIERGYTKVKNLWDAQDVVLIGYFYYEIQKYLSGKEKPHLCNILVYNHIY